MYADAKSRLESILRRWSAGDLSEQGAQDEAEDLAGDRSWPTLERSNPDSVATEVLVQLCSMDSGWITRDDIPEFLTFLEGAGRDSTEAWKNWDKYWSSLDFGRREEEIAENQFYWRTRSKKNR